MTDFEVQLVTPLGPIEETRADSVNAPGVLGQFEVLPGHIPFLTELHPGVLTLGAGKEKKVYAVTKGFLEVEPGSSVKILVEQAVMASEIDANTVHLELSSVEEKLKAWDGELDGVYQNLRDSEAWAHAKLAAKV